jgi:hypothetical protein
VGAHVGFDLSKTIGYWEDVARMHPWRVLPHPLTIRVENAAPGVRL